MFPSFPSCALAALVACCTLMPFAAASDAPLPEAAVPAELISLKLKPGEQHRLELDVNYSTGYWWMLEEQWNDKPGEEVVAVTNRYPLPDSSAPRCVGAPGKLEVILSALQTGNFRMSLAYVRPWENPPKPARRVRVEVEVCP